MIFLSRIDITVNEKYKQLSTSHQFAVISTMNILNRDGQGKKK